MFCFCALTLASSTRVVKPGQSALGGLGVLLLFSQPMAVCGQVVAQRPHLPRVPVSLRAPRSAIIEKARLRDT